MANQELISYIKGVRQKGYPDEAVRKLLVDTGWDAAEVDLAIKEIGAEEIKKENTPAPVRERSSYAFQGVAAAPQEPRRESRRVEGASSIDFGKTSIVPRRKLGLKTFIIIVALFLVFGGGGAAAYIYVVKDRIAGSEYEPNVVVGQMMNALGEISSLRYRFSLNNIDSRTLGAAVSVVPLPSVLMANLHALLAQSKTENFNIPDVSELEQQNPYDNFSYSVVVEGAHDLEGTSDFSGDFRIAIDISEESTENKFNFDLEGRYVGDKKLLYVRLNNASPFFFDFTPILNRWIKLDVKKDAELVFESAGVVGPEISDERLERTENFYRHLREKFITAGIVVGTQASPDEVLGEVPVRRFAFTIDKEALSRFLDEAQGLYIEEILKKSGDDQELADVYAKERELKKADVDLMLSTWNLRNGELWVGRNDNLPYRVQTTHDVREENEGIIFSFEAAGDMSAWNEIIREEEPAGALTFQEVFEMLMEGFVGDMKSQFEGESEP